MWNEFRLISGALIPPIFCPTRKQGDIGTKEAPVELGTLPLESQESHAKQVGSGHPSPQLSFSRGPSVENLHFLWDQAVARTVVLKSVQNPHDVGGSET